MQTLQKKIVGELKTRKKPQEVCKTSAWLGVVFLENLSENIPPETLVQNLFDILDALWSGNHFRYLYVSGSICRDLPIHRYHTKPILFSVNQIGNSAMDHVNSRRPKTIAAVISSRTF